MKTENRKFSDVFRVYRSETFVENELILSERKLEGIFQIDYSKWLILPKQTMQISDVHNFY